MQYNTQRNTIQHTMAHPHTERETDIQMCTLHTWETRCPHHRISDAAGLAQRILAEGFLRIQPAPTATGLQSRTLFLRSPAGLELTLVAMVHVGDPACLASPSCLGCRPRISQKVAQLP